MSENSKKPLANAIGAAIAGSMLLSGAANAAENPFGITELNNGYMQLASSHMEGKCGAGKCGGDMKADTVEGNCGGDMKADSMEGKCGAGKCGGDMKADSMEGNCGGDMKADQMEGKCGAGKCGGNK